ncbi:MAG TPA: sterol carrier protein [Clostridiales bacterium]|nr:sterol carrier protein [Clostridiales bacterium]
MATTAEIFEEMGKRIAANPSAIAGLKANFQFELSGDDGGTYHVNAADGKAEVGPGPTEANVTILMSADDFKAMVDGKLNATQAFMTGKLKIQGDMSLAMRLQSILQ